MERMVILSAEQHTKMLLPKYYPASRCGTHGDVKYNRRKTERDFKKMLQKGDGDDRESHTS